jgi:hypothetical protein
VDVEIHHGGPTDAAFGLQAAHRHREVVEVAEALGMIGEGVVESAAPASSACRAASSVPPADRT